MRRIMVYFACCLLGLAATIPVLAGPAAAAAVPGLQIVTTVSATSSASPKTIVATCPAGKNVIGTGAVITGGLGDVFLDDLRPAATTVTATAYTDADAVINLPIWNIRAYAICANPLPGLQIVTKVSPIDSATQKAAIAACPLGKNAIGAGGEITGGVGNVILDRIQNTGARVIAGGSENGVNNGNWLVRAYAICANPVPGFQIITAQSAFNSVSPKTIVAVCPAGKAVVSTGGWIVGGNGDVALDDLRPTANAVIATGDENGNSVLNWLVRAYAVCATP